MSRPTLLLLHGWAFDMQIWDAVLGLLPGFAAICWDRGYFGKAQEPVAMGPTVAIGHSLGAMILAGRLAPDIPLVAINGFDRFTGPHGVALRILQQMQRRFDQDATAVVDAFRQRCGAIAAPSGLDRGALRRDLDLLAFGSAAATGRKIIVLHGTLDPIVPPALRQTSFAGAARAEVADGGHLLPLTHPQWCADQIQAFACA